MIRGLQAGLPAGAQRVIEGYIETVEVVITGRMAVGPHGVSESRPRVSGTEVDPMGAEPLKEPVAGRIGPEGKSTVHGIRYSRVQKSPSLPPTVKEVCEAAVARVRRRVESEDLSPRTAEEYETASGSLLAAFGGERTVDSLSPEDFAVLRSSLATRLAKSTLHKRIGMIRTVLGHAGDLRDEQGRRRFSADVDYGREFERPTAKAIRKERAAGQRKVFTAEEVRRLLEAAGEPLRTMILLGVNCAFGNTDVAELTWSAVDLEAGWIDYPRPKTGVHRRVPLWEETAKALKRHRSERLFAEPGQLVFSTSSGKAFVRYTPHRRDSERTTKQDDLAKAFRALCDSVGVGRRGLGFYGLRHTCCTWGDACKDPVAVAAYMGHTDGSMTGVYREGVDDGRLMAVAETVRISLEGG